MGGKGFAEESKMAFSVPESLAQSIARYLEEKIIEGEMEPGMRLVPEEIAESLKVSKSPVREALLRLQKENLVSNVPRVGFFVAEVNEEDIDEIYSIRLALISLVIKTIISKEFEPGFIDKIDNIIDEMEGCVKREDVDGYFQQNVKLYNCYSEACSNYRLNDMIQQLGKQVLRFRRLGMALPGRVRRSFELNRCLVISIKNRDENKALKNFEKILNEGGIALKKQLKEIKKSRK